MTCTHCGQPIIPTRELLILSPDGTIVRVCSWPCVAGYSERRAAAADSTPFPTQRSGRSSNRRRFGRRSGERRQTPDQQGTS